MAGKRSSGKIRSRGFGNLLGALLMGSFLTATVTLQGQTPSPTPSPAANQTSEFGADGGPEAAGGDPDDGAFGLPSFLREENPATDPSVLATPTGTSPDGAVLQSVSWKAPDYISQEGALGWDENVFRVPPNFAPRVAFWKDIYAKYTTDQGVMHDMDDVTIVYEAIDFTLIMKDPRTSLKAKARARTKLVKAHRDEIAKRLEKLAKAKGEKDVRDETDRKTLALFTKESPSTLFQKDRARIWSDVRKRLQASSRKKKIRFQLGQRDKFILGVYYSGRYLRAMEKLFRDERLPIELTRLPFVESSFNVQARSRVGASGIWQFMRRTAKPAMMVNRDVDERNDPLTATASAARLMRANFEQLRAWPLALTAYNHGAAGVARAIRKTGSRDLTVIIDKYSSRRFGFASSNFYACFLAALEVEKDARRTLGDVKWSPEFDGKEVDLRRPILWRTLVDFYDGVSALAELQNPHITQRTRSKGRSIPKGTFIRVPNARLELARDYVAGRIGDDALKKRLVLTPIPKSPFGQEAAP